MRILFLCHYFPPEVNAPASRTYENAKRWVRAGHQVTVITCAPNAPRGEVYAGYRNRLRHAEVVDGIRVVRVWTYIAANKGMVRRIVNYLSYMFSATLAALLEPRPDVVVATSPQFFCGWSGVLVHKLTGWPFVLEVRDIWPESITTVGAMKKGPAIRILEAMELAMYRAATAIVAVGQGYKDNLVAKGVPPDKVNVIYNGVDLERFQARAKDRDFLARYGIEGKFVCGYIGTIGMAHGLEIMLRAAARTRDRNWAFLLVGDGARLDELKSETERLGLSNVIFTGRLGKEEMPSAWSVLDVCLIHLSRSPLFETVIPSKMFEAMGMGIPILMGVPGESLGLVLESGSGLPVVPEDDSSLIEACLRVISEGREGFGARGREYVRRKFDRETLAAEYLDVLRDVPAIRLSAR